MLCAKHNHPTRFVTRPRARTFIVTSATEPKKQPEIPNRVVDIQKILESAIHEAERVDCVGTAAQCAAAWDNVEEISAALAHKKAAELEDGDTLEQFCKEFPESDECRMYCD